jgi:hypothetical protein
MQLILLACILNIVDSLLYLIGATVFRNQQTFTNDFTNVTDIPAFVFNIVGMLAFLAESILDFFAPRVSKKPSKCSIEFFAHLLNLLENITYLAAHIVQPIVSSIASFMTSSLNTIMDFIFIIIRPIEVDGDVIYTIDAVLYIVVWIKANEQMRKVGVAWLEKGNTTFNKIVKKKTSNMTTAESLLDTTIENLPVETISKRIPEPIIEDIESVTECRPDLETLT